MLGFAALSVVGGGQRTTSQGSVALTSRRLRRTTRSVPARLSSGGIPRGGAGEGGAGGSGDDGRHEDDDDDYQAKVHAWLEKKGLMLEQWDPKVAQAFRDGVVSAREVWNFLVGTGAFGGRLVLLLGASARARFLADELFLARIAMELGLGVVGKMTAEISVRREKTIPEIDFVLANLVTALLADFFLAYLPAPSVNYTGKQIAQSAMRKFVDSLPSNIFQAGSFPLWKRLFSLVVKGSQLASVGLVCAATGFALSNLSILAREQFLPDYHAKTEKTNILAVSLVYALFLASSSGMRYQIVCGIENRIFPHIFGTNELALTTASLIMRFGNTVLGSSHWIFFARFFGLMQSTH